MDFRFYLTLFLRRIHWFLIVAILGAAAGIMLAKILPAVYTATATLVVESEQIPGSLAASTVQTQAVEQLQIIQQRILTRDTLVDMANRLQIYAPGPGQSAQQMDADVLVADLRKRIMIVTTGGVETRRGPTQATLVTVSFEAPTADLAASVTNDVVTQILKIDVEMRTGSARQTLDFFEQAVTRLDKAIAERGAAILKYKEENKDALPDSLEYRRTLQTTAHTRLLQQEQAGSDLQTVRDRMVRHIAAPVGVTANPTVPARQQTAGEQQLHTLQDQLTAQQSVLSPENPKIKLLQTQIAALQKGVAGQSTYDVQLADIDAQIAQNANLQAQTKAAIAALQVTLDATPGNTSALDTLQRDYNNLKAQYEIAVTSRARAQTGDTIETMSKGQRISVVEQAVAPTDPTRPNRKAIAAGGVGGGVVLGLVLVALIEFLHFGIRRPAAITSRLGITVFATLPYLKSPGEIRWRRLRIALFFLGILGAVAVALWAVDTYYMPLDLLTDQIIKRFSLLAVSAQTLA